MMTSVKNIYNIKTLPSKTRLVGTFSENFVLILIRFVTSPSVKVSKDKSVWRSLEIYICIKTVLDNSLLSITNTNTANRFIT